MTGRITGRVLRDCLAGLLLLALLAPALSLSAVPKQTILNPASPRKAAYPKIVIFTVAWCPHCRELKEYLTSHDIPFINRDVEIDPSAMTELTDRYKTYGVPVIVIGNDQVIQKGFTEDGFVKALEKVRSGGR